METANARGLYYTIYNLQLYNSFMKQAPELISAGERAVAENGR